NRQPDAAGRVTSWMLADELRHEGVEGRLRRGGRDAGAQPCHDRARPRGADVGRPREPDVDERRDAGAFAEIQAEAARHDADDRHLQIVDFDVAAENRRVAVPTTLPELVADIDAVNTCRPDV